MYPTVGLFASPEIFGIYLVKSFLEKGFPIVIISQRISEWEMLIKSNGLSGKVRITKTREFSPYEVVVDFQDYSNFSLYRAKSSLEVKKTLIVSPLSNYEAISHYLKILETQTIKTLYISEIIGIQNFIKSKGVLNSAIYKAAIKKETTLPQNQVNAVFESDLLNIIQKELFSYGSNQSYYIARLIDSKKVGESISKVFDSRINYADNTRTESSPLPLYPLKDIDLDEEFKSLSIEFPKNEQKKAIAEKPIKPAQKSKNLNNIKFHFLLYFVIAGIWLFITPFILLFISTFILWRAQYLLQSGENTQALSFVRVATSSAKASKNIFSLYSSIPLAGQYVIPVREAADYVYQGGFIATRVINLIANTKTLFRGVLSGQEYDIEAISQELYLDFDSVYTEISFLEGDLKGFNRNLFNLYPKLSQVFSSKSHLGVARAVAKNLPELLGKDTPKTYLVLFQNNMELRPTGGFIGSFGLITFENGRLIDTVVYDVYEADGQLKGYVAPPKPISEYLGEETWYLRDSNWDIHFPKSAERAEWFLDKTLDRQVDGVIGINLEVAKKLLNVTGPVVLLDYKDEITADNMYEKVQYEVEDSFFSGSKKKANYLTSLSKTLIEKIKNVEESDYLSLAQEMWGSIESRDIQLAMHNKEVSETLSASGWDGGVVSQGCGNFCQEIKLGLVEANLGVNKSNYFIRRVGGVSVEISNNNLFINQTLTITNSAKTGEKIPERRYKTYIRSINPSSSKISKVQIQDAIGSYWQTPDIEKQDNRIEAGVLVEILPGQTKTLTFTSEVPLQGNSLTNSINLIVRKQSGVQAYPLTIDILSQQEKSLKGIPAFTLTGERIYRYNTNLSEDIVRMIYW